MATPDILLSIMMLATGALIWGSIVLWRRGEDRRKALLMGAAAFVLLGNVLIWTV